MYFRQNMVGLDSLTGKDIILCKREIYLTETILGGKQIYAPDVHKCMEFHL